MERRRALRPGAQHRRRRRVPRRLAQTGASRSSPTARRSSASRSDPMPASLRLGQQLFYSANSDECPSRRTTGSRARRCHLEGRSDAASRGSSRRARATRRPTPAACSARAFSSARPIARRCRTTGRRSTRAGRALQPVRPGEPAQKAAARRAGRLRQLRHPGAGPADATDPRRSRAASSVFKTRSEGGLHVLPLGPDRTDSGIGQPDARPRLGTDPAARRRHVRDERPLPDVAHDDVDGDPRAACMFDTPSLRGLWDSAPYLHDGSAATLDDVIPVMLQATGPGVRRRGRACRPTIVPRSSSTSAAYDHRETNARRRGPPRRPLRIGDGRGHAAAPPLHVCLRDAAQG